MADNKHVPEKEGSSSADSGRSITLRQRRLSPAAFAAFVMIKNDASSQVPCSKFSMIKPAEKTTRVESPGQIEVVSSETTGPAMVKPAEQTTRLESPGEIEVASSQGPTLGPAVVIPAEETTRVESPVQTEVVSSQGPTLGPAVVIPAEETKVVSPGQIEVVSSQGPTLGPAVVKPAEETIRVESPGQIEVVSSQGKTIGPAMVKPAEVTTRVESLGQIEVVSSQGKTIGPAMVKPAEETTRLESPGIIEAVSSQIRPTYLALMRPAEQTSRVENFSFVLTPMNTPPMNSPVSDLEGISLVSSKWESQVEFRCGMSASSSREEDIRAGNEPTLGGMEGISPDMQHVMNRLQRLNVDNLSFFPKPRTPPINLVAFDFGGSAHVSSERKGLFEFCYGMNPLSKPEDDIRTGNEPMLGGMEGVHQGIRNLTDGIQRLRENPPQFLQNSRTVPITMLTSGVEGNPHASFDRDTLFEFYHSMNGLSIRDEDLHRGNEQMPDGTGGFYQDTQHLWQEMHKISVNIPSPSEDSNLSYELSPSDTENLRIELSTIGIRRQNSLNNVSPGRLYGIEFPSDRQYPDLNLSEDPLDKRVVDDAKKLCSAFNENVQGENLDLTDSDISEEYLKLYRERAPDRYDFAMNIMAHIELLNDKSWTATVSYFDKNVKRMVTSIWNKTHTILQNTMNLQGYNRLMVVKLISHFTRLSVNENFKVETFLKYCVLLCQLGVITSKSIFKEAPFYVIMQIRKRIKFLKSESLLQLLLDIVAKDYAEGQHKM